MPSSSTTNTLVIGAGLSGLMLARRLANRSDSVIVAEKSKGVGGRLATRRTETLRFDHGAQYYTRQAPLEEIHQLWVQSSLVSHWFDADSKAHFSAATGMTALAKQMAKDLDVRFEHKITTLVKSAGGWQLTCETGEVLNAKRVVLTAPLPQALELLRANHLAYDPTLEHILYAKAIVALIEPENLAGIAGPHGYLQPQNSMIFSIADQKAKGVSLAPALTVTLRPDESETLYSETDDRLCQVIGTELLKLNPEFKAKSMQIKKWRYAHPTATFAKPFYGSSDSDLFLMGDAFGGPSLNGAARSAKALSDFLAEGV